MISSDMLYQHLRHVISNMNQTRWILLDLEEAPRFLVGLPRCPVFLGGLAQAAHEDHRGVVLFENFVAVEDVE